MSVKETLEDIRREQGWPTDDVILIIHTDKANQAKVEKALQDVGIKNSDGIEVVPSL